MSLSDDTTCATSLALAPEGSGQAGLHAGYRNGSLNRPAMGLSGTDGRPPVATPTMYRSSDSGPDAARRRSYDDLRFVFDIQGYLHLRGALISEEVAEYTRWMEEAEKTDVHVLNADHPKGMKRQLNRPVSRVIDADPRFARFLDHPAVEPLLVEFLGPDYRHIDNELYYIYPGYQGGPWHQGVRPHPTGHVVDGRFLCPMVKVFYCMTDVGPGEGEFVAVPGSHRAQFKIAHRDRLDLPGQRVFDDVKAGDVILFNEGMLHTGRPNPSWKTRKTIIFNFGRSDAGVWPGYAPSPRTLEAATPHQREILTNPARVWAEPDLRPSRPKAKKLFYAFCSLFSRSKAVSTSCSPAPGVKGLETTS